MYKRQPKGISSFDVIRALRKKLGIWKMGHAGTLDPNATGLLIIATGAETKRLASLLGLPKTYEAEILLGKKTDSGDITGVVIEEKSVPAISELGIKRALDGLIGNHFLRVPIYSAIKKAGKPLYKYARDGEEVEAPIKEMRVISAFLLKVDGGVISVSLGVSSGSYIRTLAELLAERLGTVGTVLNLRRTSIGDFKIENAKKIEDFGTIK